MKFGRHLRNGTIQCERCSCFLVAFTCEICAFHVETEREYDPFQPNRNHLNLGSFPVFVGGVPDNARLPPIDRFNKSYSGAIQQLTINGAIIDINVSNLSNQLSFDFSIASGAAELILVEFFEVFPVASHASFAQSVVGGVKTARRRSFADRLESFAHRVKWAFSHGAK